MVSIVSALRNHQKIKIENFQNFSNLFFFIFRWVGPRERKIQIHLRRFGSDFLRVGGLNSNVSCFSLRDYQCVSDNELSKIKFLNINCIFEDSVHVFTKSKKKKSSLPFLLSSLFFLWFSTFFLFIFQNFLFSIPLKIIIR